MNKKGELVLGQTILQLSGTVETLKLLVENGSDFSDGQIERSLSECWNDAFSASERIRMVLTEGVYREDGFRPYDRGSET